MLKLVAFSCYLAATIVLATSTVNHRLQHVDNVPSATLLQQSRQQHGKSFLSTLASTLLPIFMSQRNGDEHDTAASIPFNIADLLRVVGVDSNKIGTMVINAIVYVIEMISNHFFGVGNTVESRQFNTASSFIYFLFDTKRAENFLQKIADPEVPNNVIRNLQKVTGNDTVCIQQLICKMSPFWWGVNKSVRDLLPSVEGNHKTSSANNYLPDIGWSNLLKKYVPTVDEFSDNSNLCETRYPGCVVVTYRKSPPTSVDSA